MATVSVDLGSVIGPQGATGPAGTYVLTSQDKEDIAEIIGDDKYLPASALKIDAYNADTSRYPSVIDYIIGTVTVADSDGNTIATLSTNRQRVTMYCPPYSRYIVTVTGSGYTTPASQTVVVQPTGSTLGFSMEPTSETWFDVVYKVDGTIVQTNRVEAHANVPYTGSTPSVSGKIWTGWDGTADDVIADTTINATFVTPSQPASPAVTSEFNYAWTDDTEHYTSAYTDAEFAWILTQCAASDISTYLSKGDKIRFGITVGTGMTTDHLEMEIVGWKHYELSDGSGWGKIAWMSTDLMDELKQWNSSATNVGGWASCALRTWMNNTLYPLLPLFMRGMIKQAKVISSIGGNSLRTSETDNYLWVPSYGEMNLSASTSPYVDEVATGADEVNFSKFVSNASRVKARYTTGTAVGYVYWTRSPNPSTSTGVHNVNSDGSGNDYASRNATDSYGVAPCFTT